MKTTMKRLFSFLIVFLWVVTAYAQIMNPVHFVSKLNILKNGEAEIVFSATVDPGWHVYSTDLGDAGPIEASFHADRMEGAELVGKLEPRGKEHKNMDPIFGTEVKYFENKAAFVQRIRFTKSSYDISCYLEYGACNNEMCLPPTQVEFKEKGKAALQTASEKDIEALPTEKVTIVTPIETKEESAVAHTDTSGMGTEASPDTLWLPVTAELQAFEQGGTDESMSWWMIFLEGLLGGFLAILTPCVWPVIPMTVSFFLKRNKDRKKAVGEAVVYGVSIVVIYVLLGLLVTLLFGASALNALSTNAVFNIFFALLLIVFAASFFGAFELTLPSSWSNRVDQKVDELQASRRSPITSYLSIFLMAFTLTLVSFSCTGPIIGFLLVAVSTQGSIVAPTIGMLGFAIALAIPFTVFAIFPSWLKQAPKSGGWMNTVKVVLGFVELAFALKFLSVADLAYGWHLLDREVFLSLWIVMFALLGCYLLGWLKFPHDDDSSRTHIPQFFLGLVSLAFAVYMVPGLWGAPLKAISAFAPPINTQDFNLYQGSVEARYKDYELGMAAARAEGKPVMVDFTGYGCVNCRKMEAAVWTDVKVQDLLNNQYVLISLYVDDKTPLSEPVEVTELDGQKRILRTMGDKWSFLQRTKVGMNTQPCYVLLNPTTGKPLNGLRSYNENIEDYVHFLQTGLKNYD